MKTEYNCLLKMLKWLEIAGACETYVSLKEFLH